MAEPAVDDGLDAMVPTFDLVADDIAEDAAKPRLFDFGNDPDLPDELKQLINKGVTVKHLKF